MSKRIFSWNNPNEIASAFGDDVFELIDEYNLGRHQAFTLKMREAAGDGFLELHSIDDALSVVIINCRFDKDVVVDIKDLDRVRLNFSLDLDMLLDLGAHDELLFNQPSWRVINNLESKVIQETYFSGSRALWVTIAVAKDYINEHFGNDLLEASSQLMNVFDKPTTEALYLEYPLDNRLSQIVSNILSSHLDDRLHLNYIKAKGIELLCAGIDIILDTSHASPDPVKLKSKDEKAIKLTREILVRNLSQTPTIKEICRMVGMNRNKMHYGFKALYGMSVSKYLQEIRLTEAYKQLQDTDQSILQIAVNVGFGHQSSFSTAFRKKYGCSPLQVRK